MLTDRAARHFPFKGKMRVAGAAPGAVELAVHVEQALRTGAVVEVVDILRDQQQFPCPGPVEPRERLVRGIGLDGLQLRTALVVEFLDQSGVADKGLGRGDILDPVPFPQTVRPAKGGDAAFGADAGAGEDDDIVDSV